MGIDTKTKNKLIDGVITNLQFVQRSGWFHLSL